MKDPYRNDHKYLSVVLIVLFMPLFSASQQIDSMFKDNRWYYSVDVKFPKHFWPERPIINQQMIKEDGEGVLTYGNSLMGQSSNCDFWGLRYFGYDSVHILVNDTTVLHGLNGKIRRYLPKQGESFKLTYTKDGLVTFNNQTFTYQYLQKFRYMSFSVGTLLINSKP